MTRRMDPTCAGMTTRGDEFAGAEFSASERHRYRLWRAFGRLAAPAPRFVAFVMLNPSTADENVLDPTLRRCEGFAKTWGFDGFMVANVFALRSTDPKGLLEPCADPVGHGNAAAIKRVCGESELVVCGWGAFADCDAWRFTLDGTLQRIRAVREPHHLGLTKTGQPRHPLYLRADVKPQPFTRAA